MPKQVENGANTAQSMLNEAANDFKEQYDITDYKKMLWELVKYAIGSTAMDGSYAATRADYLLLYENTCRLVDNIAIQ